MFKKLQARYAPFYRTYHSLIYLGIVAGMAELAYSVLNQSAIPPYVQEIGLTARLGVIFVVFLAVETLLKSPMGHLGDKWGRRPLIVGGALVSCVTAFLMAMTTRLDGLIALRAFDGVACAAIWPTIIAAMSGSVPPAKRTTAMSTLTMVYIAGLSLGPLAGGLVNDVTGTKTASFYLVSLIFIATAVVAYFLTPHRSAEDLQAHEEDRPIRFADIAVGIRTVPDLMLLSFAAFFATGLLLPIVKLFAMNELGMTETGYGAVIFPVAAAVAVASAFSGKLGDRWGKVRAVRLGVFLTAAAMWTVLTVRQPWQFAVAGIVLGVGFAIALPAWLALVSDIAAPHMRGAVIGAVGTAQGVGAALGALLGPWLYATAKFVFAGIAISPRYSPFATSAAALTVCVVLVFLFMKEGDTRHIG